MEGREGGRRRPRCERQKEEDEVLLGRRRRSFVV